MRSPRLSAAKAGVGMMPISRAITAVAMPRPVRPRKSRRPIEPRFRRISWSTKFSGLIGSPSRYDFDMFVYPLVGPVVLGFRKRQRRSRGIADGDGFTRLEEIALADQVISLGEQSADALHFDRVFRGRAEEYPVADDALERTVFGSAKAERFRAQTDRDGLAL